MRAGHVVRAIEVIEGRDVEQGIAVEVVNPTESGEGVSFMLAVAELAGGGRPGFRSQRGWGRRVFGSSRCEPGKRGEAGCWGLD